MSDAEAELIMRTLVESIQTYEQVIEVCASSLPGEVELIHRTFSFLLLYHNTWVGYCLFHSASSTSKNPYVNSLSNS